jgi:hypothetical protein
MLKKPGTLTYVVRYPKISVGFAVAFLATPVIGFFMAIDGRGHWTFRDVALQLSEFSGWRTY